MAWQPLPCAVGHPRAAPASRTRQSPGIHNDYRSDDGQLRRLDFESVELVGEHHELPLGFRRRLAAAGRGGQVTHTFSDTVAHTVTLTVSDSADAATRRPSSSPAASPEAVVGALHAQGCLFDDSDRWLAVGSLSINGLQLAPVGRVSASLYKNPVRLAVNGTARDQRRRSDPVAGAGAGLVDGYVDTLKLKIPGEPASTACRSPVICRLSLSAEDGGAVDGEASADLGGITADALFDPLKAGGLLRAALEPEGHASVKLRWSRDRGFELDHVSLVGKRLQLGAAAAPFWLSDFNLTYEHSGNDNIFTGEAGFGGPFSPIVRARR